MQQVEFIGKYPMDGASGVHTTITRYVARICRHAPRGPSKAKPATLVLRVKEDRSGLQGSLSDGSAGAGAAEEL